MRNYFYIIFFVLIFSSCDFFSDTEVINLDFPSDLNGRECEIFFNDLDNSIRRENIFLTENNQISLVLKKNHPSSVLLVSKENFSSFGYIYPFTDSFRDKDSFVGEVLLTLNYLSSKDKSVLENIIFYFNWNKFISLCREFENPDLLDKDSVVDSILSKTFRKSLLKERNKE